jgi:hypothetical protein
MRKMTTNKSADWVLLKDATPPNQAEVEVRTNSMDRKFRIGKWDQAYKCFYGDEDNIIEGQEWRMLVGKTPCTDRVAIIMKSVDDKPEGYVQDYGDSNEYGEVWVHPTDDSRMPYVYSYPEEEITSRW